MRILIHGANFSPERIGIGKYSGEMAEWLAGRGHEVRVVTAPPYYPEWRVGPGYSSWKFKREVLKSQGASLEAQVCPAGLTVWRCPLWVPARPSGLKRILHLASFALSSFPVMVRQIFWRPDVVLVVEPPLFCAPQAWLVARLSGARAWLHVQDFEVDAAFDLGILRAPWLRHWVLAAERWLMRRFDVISTISPKMQEKLADKLLKAGRTIYFPNWVDLDMIHPRQCAERMRREFDIPSDRPVALYSGNMGEKQGLEVVLEAARLARSDARVQFVLCGDGASKQRLMKVYAGLENVSWIPLQPTERLNELLNLAEIHLLPQRADVADLVMPSKLTGMLASGRPVVATAYPGTQVARIVAECGMVTSPGDAAALWAALRKLVESPEERERLGRAARRYAELHLGKEVVLAQFEQELQSVV